MSKLACDKTLPRVRKKYSSVLTKELWKKFKRKFREYPLVTLKDMEEIINAFNVAMVDKAVDHREGIMLPELLGHVILASFKRTSRKNINWSESAKHGKLIYHMNWNTDNRIVKIVHLKPKYTVGSVTNMYSLIPTRSFSQKASEAFLKNYSKFIFVNKNMYTELGQL